MLDETQDNRLCAVDEDDVGITELLQIMARLRDPKLGCEWDQQQTFATIAPYTIEEAYEVADAIAKGDIAAIREELGDLLYQVVFHAQIAQEQDAFSFADVTQGISAKLRRRHPHIFPDIEGNTTAPEKDQWEKIKAQERLAAGKDQDDSILAHIPSSMSPLLRAQKMQQRCAKFGFDWPQLAPVLDKLQEEVDEVLSEVNAAHPDQEAIEDEIGDVLFCAVNLARHLNVDAQTALSRASNKFEKRFRQVEHIARAKGQTIDNTSLDELETFWQQAKRQTQI